MAGAVLEAQDHQDLPFERLVTELNLARELGHNPLFQVSFAFDNTPVPKVALKDLTIEAIEAETTTAMFDLAVDIVDSADGLSISFEYNTDLFFRSTIERLAAHYAVLLDSIVAAPEARIGDLAVLPETKRCALLAAGNGAAAASLAAWQARSASTVVALAEDSAARFPDQPALIEGETRLTYRELNLRANRLAHRLIGLGAGPEAAVAVYARRSIELTVAILAVSKTGAAYVALRSGLSARAADACFAVLVRGSGTNRYDYAAGAAAGCWLPHPGKRLLQ